MASMKPRKSSLPPPKARQAVTVGAPKRDFSGRIIIGAIVAAAIVLGVVLALVLGGGDDDGGEAIGVLPIEQCAADDTGTTTAADGAADPDPFVAGEMTQPVAVSGEGLDPFTQQIIEGETADTARCQRAPVVSGYDYEGNPVTIDATTDGPTMVVLLAHWCPHCNAEIPVLNEWRESGAVPDNLNVVGVSTAVSSERANFPPDQWLVDRDWQWPVLADSAEATAFQAYGGEYFPTIVIIGPDGRVLVRFSGEPSAEEIDTIVDAALEADPR